jgi:UDP-glucuronate 4-epimerase
MKTILITGVAGFIGARVAELLLHDGVNVVGIDNFSEYYDPRLKEYRIAQFSNQKGFTLVRADITNSETINSVFAQSKISAVIHLAGMAGIRTSKDHPLEFERTNVGGTAVLLRLMQTHQVSSLVFASSSSVYAGNIPPFTEDMNTDSPSSIYAATKKSAELLISSYHSLFDFNSVILRYFSVYGPQGRPDMSYFRFIRAIDEHRPIHIYGDGTQRRDFTFVDDIARGTINALKIDGFHICNLASGGASNSLNDLIELIESRLKKKAVKIYEPNDASDLPNTQADTTRARQILQWGPTVQFENGMSTTLDWYLEHKSFIQGLRND